MLHLELNNKKNDIIFIIIVVIIIILLLLLLLLLLIIAIIIIIIFCEQYHNEGHDTYSTLFTPVASAFVLREVNINF